MELVVAHCGGPSATLNAGLVGLVDACRDEGEPVRVLGARRGAEGLLAGDWAELTSLSPAALESIMRRPGSALGTSQRGVSAEEAREIVTGLAGRGVDALVCAGGSGAMGIAALLARTAGERKSGLKVIGLPSSALNDVVCTDHAAGFASAARFCALAIRDMSEDSRALPAPVTVIETLGRNTGWVAAAAALGRASEQDGPHLVFLPEQRAEQEQMLEDVKAAVERWGRAVVVTGEGIGLAERIQSAAGLGVRAERLGLLARSCSWTISEVDVEETYRSGRAAAEAALGGTSGVLIALQRKVGLAYRSFPHAVPFSEDPGRERAMPREWVGEAGQGGTEDYLEWLRPLAGEIPPIERIL